MRGREPSGYSLLFNIRKYQFKSLFLDLQHRKSQMVESDSHFELLKIKQFRITQKEKTHKAEFRNLINSHSNDLL